MDCMGPWDHAIDIMTVLQVHKATRNDTATACVDGLKYIHIMPPSQYPGACFCF